MIDGLDKDIRILIDATKENRYNMKDMNETLQACIVDVAKKLHIGFFCSNIIIPYAKPPVAQSFSIYEDPNGYSKEKTYTYEFFIGEFTNGTPCTVICSPVIDYTWNDEELEYIKFIIQLVILLCSRSHLLGLIRVAYERDIITGIPNFAGLLRFIKEISTKDIRANYTCIYSNIKNFKVVNSIYGSKKADDILSQYSMLLKNYVKDGIVARLGGDNFFIILPNEKVRPFIDFLNNIEITPSGSPSDAKPYPIRTRGGILPITLDLSPRSYVHYAASAYGYAKNSGTDDFCWFTPDILHTSVYKKEISDSFPGALTNKEFVVYYQPKVDLKNMNLCGGEALVRWEKNGSLIQPMDFIPVLETEGTICQLDFYVLERVCKQLRKWIDKGYEVVPISVNFSKMHLQNTTLVQDVLTIIDRYNIDHSLLEIEVTELSDFENYEALSNFINAMDENGIRISVDDFGTGFSSINLLKNTSISTIKLDKTMLDELFSENKNTSIIIRNVVNMANELDLDVLAEGVETNEHVEFLTQANCNKAQGFLFDKPMPAEDFEYRIQNSKY